MSMRPPIGPAITAWAGLSDSEADRTGPTSREAFHWGQVPRNVGRGKVATANALSIGLGCNPQEELLPLCTGQALGCKTGCQAGSDGCGSLHAHHRLHHVEHLSHRRRTRWKLLEQVNKVRLQRYFLKRLRGLGLIVKPLSQHEMPIIVGGTSS